MQPVGVCPSSLGHLGISRCKATCAKAENPEAAFIIQNNIHEMSLALSQRQGVLPGHAMC